MFFCKKALASALGCLTAALKHSTGKGEALHCSCVQANQVCGERTWLPRSEVLRLAQLQPLMSRQIGKLSDACVGSSRAFRAELQLQSSASRVRLPLDEEEDSSGGLACGYFCMQPLALLVRSLTARAPFSVGARWPRTRMHSTCTFSRAPSGREWR